MKTALEKGCEQILKCMGFKQNEKLLIITDLENLEQTKIIEELGKLIGEVKLIPIEDYGVRPLTEFPPDLKEKVFWCDVCIYLKTKMKEEQMSLSYPLKNICIAEKKRLAFMNGAVKEVIEIGMNVDYKKIKSISTKVFDLVSKAKEIKVKTKAGTDVTIDILDCKWKNTYGDLSKTPQDGFNLPSGEVFTCPNNIHGKFVCDLEIGGYFTEKYGVLVEPVNLTITKGVIKTIGSKNNELQKELNEILKKIENSNKISEVGIGTNIGLEQPIGKFLLDEKFPGLHIAMGNPCTGTGGDWKCDVHYDFLIQKANIWVDGKKIMKDGKFVLK